MSKHYYVTHAPHLTGPIKRDGPPKIQPTTHAAPSKAIPLWGKLHIRALEYDGSPDPAFLEEFARLVPCGDCKRHWFETMRHIPPDFANYFEWTVTVHNAVNQRLGKPILTVEAARERWLVDSSASSNGAKALR